MKLVELTYFPGEGSHRSPILVNPDHIAFVLAADSGKDGRQCWIRMAATSGTGGGKDFLVAGSFDELVNRFSDSYDPSIKRDPT